MDLRIVGVSQWLDIYVPVRLMFADVVPEPCNESLIIVLCLAIDLGLVGCSRQLLSLKEAAKSREELANKLWAVFCQDESGNSIRHDPMV